MNGSKPNSSAGIGGMTSRGHSRQAVRWSITRHPGPLPWYVFSVVGTSRCDVRAACSGAIPSNASAARLFVPPATTRAGTAQRAIPTIALNTYLSWGEGEPCSPRSTIQTFRLSPRGARCSLSLRVRVRGNDANDLLAYRTIPGLGESSGKAGGFLK